MTASQEQQSSVLKYSPRYHSLASPIMDVQPLLKSYVTALIVRSILYGLYFTSLVHCLRWLLFEDRDRKLRAHIDWRLVSITMFIFFFLTTALGITSQITLDLVLGDKHSAMLAIVKVTFSQLGFLHKMLKLSFQQISIENAAVLITNAVLVSFDVAVYKTKPTDCDLVDLALLGCLHQQITLGHRPPAYRIMGLRSSKRIPHRVLLRRIPAHTSRRANGIFSAGPPLSFLLDRVLLLRHFGQHFHNRYEPHSFVSPFCDLLEPTTTAAIIFRLLGASDSFRQSSRQLHTTCKILALFGTLYTITTILSLTSLIVDVKSKHDTLRFTLDAIVCPTSLLSLGSLLTPVQNFSMPGITFNLVQVRVRQERASQGDQTLCDPRAISKFTQAASASAGSQTWPYSNSLPSR